MKIKKDYWSNQFYICSDRCGFTGSSDAFTYGQCYRPCPKCGAKREQVTGRYVYKKIKYGGFLGWLGLSGWVHNYFEKFNKRGQNEFI